MTGYCLESHTNMHILPGPVLLHQTCTNENRILHQREMNHEPYPLRAYNLPTPHCMCILKEEIEIGFKFWQFCKGEGEEILDYVLFLCVHAFRSNKTQSIYVVTEF
jgi:hypothetical protein